MEFIIALIIFYGIVSGIAFLAAMFWLILDCFENKNGAKLKLKSFKKFYNINPDSRRWQQEGRPGCLSESFQSDNCLVCSYDCHQQKRYEFDNGCGNLNLACDDWTE